VHAKASTKCPYLTLENPHHQRQHCCVIAVITVIKRFFLFPLHWRLRGEVLPALSNANFHGIVQKNPFTMSKTNQLANANGPVIAGATSATANWLPTSWTEEKSGGAYRDRTDDLMLAKQPLSQLS
jgi:hypothetical protein